MPPTVSAAAAGLITSLHIMGEVRSIEASWAFMQRMDKLLTLVLDNEG